MLVELGDGLEGRCTWGCYSEDGLAWCWPLKSVELGVGTWVFDLLGVGSWISDGHGVGSRKMVYL